MNAYTMAWTPAPPKRLVLPMGYTGKTLGQQKVYAMPPVMGMLTAGLTSFAAGYLAWGYSKQGNNWSTFWYVVSAVSAVKALHDLSNI